MPCRGRGGRGGKRPPGNPERAHRCQRPCAGGGTHPCPSSLHRASEGAAWLASSFYIEDRGGRLQRFLEGRHFQAPTACGRFGNGRRPAPKIGRASCRERV